jgi:hypothetical protein
MYVHVCHMSGLPDGIFACQKFQFWYVLEAFGMETLGMFHYVLCFYGNLVFLLAIWYTYICGYVLGIFNSHLVSIYLGLFSIIFQFWYVIPLIK